MSKTLRQFQCRDDLWSRVDALAKRRGISTDDVVQAALLQLFKSKKKDGESSAVSPAPTAAPTGAATPHRRRPHPDRRRPRGCRGRPVRRYPRVARSSPLCLPAWGPHRPRARALAPP